MNEIGWVKIPILGRAGTVSPSSSIVAWLIRSARHGVQGARITSTSSKSASTRSRYQLRKRCARWTQAAGIVVPAIRRSRTAGS